MNVSVAQTGRQEAKEGWPSFRYFVIHSSIFLSSSFVRHWVRILPRGKHVKPQPSVFLHLMEEGIHDIFKKVKRISTKYVECYECNRTMSHGWGLRREGNNLNGVIRRGLF